MVKWSEDDSDDDAPLRWRDLLKATLTETVQEPAPASRPPRPFPLQHSTFCGVLAGLAFFGGLFLLLGFLYGTDGCDDDSLFEILGNWMFYLSVAGVPVNGFIFFVSLTDKETQSSEVFLWSMLHLAVLVMSFVAFAAGITQDMFCGSGGPHYDLGAGF